VAKHDIIEPAIAVRRREREHGAAVVADLRLHATSIGQAENVYYTCHLHRSMPSEAFA
jgi:hypothetical protein